jgi:hypothetical protein
MIANNNQNELDVINLLEMNDVKTWIVTNQMINAIVIGGESSSPSYNEFWLFAYEEVKEEISSIYAGTVKAFPIAKFKRRIYCVIKNHVSPIPKNLEHKC